LTLQKIAVETATQTNTKLLSQKINFFLFSFPLLLCKMSNSKQTRNRYELATRPNLNYVRFALVIFIVGFVLSSVVDKDAFSKCMQVYNNSDICYKLN
tara:strand:- start:141 stop:434 length:294 start_codon:yes stop_codon:yes gene_type:complete